MPQFRVKQGYRLNHNGEMLEAGTVVELPNNVAGHENVRGMIDAIDDEGKIALLPPADASVVGTANVRAGAPLREHEINEERNRLVSEKSMYASRMQAIDAKLAALDGEVKRLRDTSGPAPQPGGVVNAAQPGTPAPGPTPAPAPSGPQPGTVQPAQPMTPSTPSPAPGTAQPAEPARVAREVETQ